MYGIRKSRLEHSLKTKLYSLATQKDLQKNSHNPISSKTKATTATGCPLYTSGGKIIQYNTNHTDLIGMSNIHLECSSMYCTNCEYIIFTTDLIIRLKHNNMFIDLYEKYFTKKVDKLHRNSTSVMCIAI